MYVFEGQSLPNFEPSRNVSDPGRASLGLMAALILCIIRDAASTLFDKVCNEGELQARPTQARNTNYGKNGFWKLKPGEFDSKED
jgi:hypothetical protein